MSTPTTIPGTTMIVGGRSPFSPYPSLGLPPRWRVSDMTPSYSTPVLVVPATSSTVTSAPYDPAANSIEVYPQFSDGETSCTITVLNDNGTGTFVPVAVFNGIDLFHASGITVGEWPQGISLGGRNIQIEVSNIVGTGTVTVKVQRLN
jgi:hypothetical protein